MITDTWHVTVVAREAATGSRQADHDARVHVHISGRISEAQDNREAGGSWDAAWCECAVYVWPWPRMSSTNWKFAFSGPGSSTIWKYSWVRHKIFHQCLNMHVLCYLNAAIRNDGYIRAVHLALLSGLKVQGVQVIHQMNCHIGITSQVLLNLQQCYFIFLLQNLHKWQ